MLIASQNNAVKYVGVFLGAAGIYPCIPNTVVWVSLSCYMICFREGPNLFFQGVKQFRGCV